MISDDQAEEEMYDVLLAAINDPLTGAELLLGYIPDVVFPGIEITNKSNHEKFWLRPSVQIVEQPQSTLNGGINGSGVRFTTSGLFFCQVFCPKKDNKGATDGKKLSIIIRNKFRTAVTPGKIWFRNPTIKSLDDEAHFHRFNVVAEYQYDEKV